jgi:hypothetical protein
MTLYTGGAALGKAAQLRQRRREKKRRFLAEPPPMYRTICSN